MSVAPMDLTDVFDPDQAYAISAEGVAGQRREETAFRALVQQLEALRMENHIAERLENLLGQRR